MPIYIKFLIIFAGYWLGAIPFGLIIAKKVRGIDIREHGSGNIGATNAYRVLGRGPGVLVFILDTLKGALPCWFMSYLLHRYEPNLPIGQHELWTLLPGVGAVLGHSLSPFIDFKGGKSVSTGFGLLLGVAPDVAIIGITVFGIIVLITRYISAGSIIAAISIPLIVWQRHHSTGMVIIVTIGCAMIVYRHRANISRIMQGTEPKIGKSKRDEKSIT